MFLQPHEFVGDVECSKNSDAQGVDGITAGRDSTHLGVHSGRELLYVLGIVRTQVIRLVVNIHTDGRGRAPNFKIICHGLRSVA